MSLKFQLKVSESEPSVEPEIVDLATDPDLEIASGEFTGRSYGERGKCRKRNYNKYTH